MGWLLLLYTFIWIWSGHFNWLLGSRSSTQRINVAYPSHDAADSRWVIVIGCSGCSFVNWSSATDTSTTPLIAVSSRTSLSAQWLRPRYLTHLNSITHSQPMQHLIPPQQLIHPWFQTFTVTLFCIFNQDTFDISEHVLKDALHFAVSLIHKLFSSTPDRCCLSTSMQRWDFSCWALFSLHRFREANLI
jgi:hypothetical protein